MENNIYRKDFKSWVGGRVVSPAQHTYEYVSRTNSEIQRPQVLKGEGYINHIKVRIMC
jgi:hypothetical protein